MTWQCQSMVVAALFAVGCAGPFVNVAPSPPAGAVTTRIGRGSACGVNLMGIIPINVNNRAQRAYDEAVDDADASGLTDTKVTDRWSWIFIGEKFCTYIQGTGYRLEGAPTSAH